MEVPEMIFVLLLPLMMLSANFAQVFEGGLPRDAPDLQIIAFFEPVYPSVARLAGIEGDVKFQLSIRPDGQVESVTTLSGPPELVQAARESVQQARFRCRGCREGNITYLISYTFRVQGTADPCCCTSGHPGPAPDRVERDFTSMQGHVTLTASPVCVCPDKCALERARKLSRFRSAKCLYLWKCGHRRVLIY